MKETLKENGSLLVWLLSNCRQKGSQDTHYKLSAWQLTQCLVISIKLFFNYLDVICNCLTCSFISCIVAIFMSLSYNNEWEINYFITVRKNDESSTPKIGRDSV